MIKHLFFTFFTAFLVSGFICLDSLIEWGQPDFIRGKNLTLDDLEFSLIVTDRNDREIYRNFTQENREWAGIEVIPQTLKIATVMAEDKRFYSHKGIDPKGILRAAFVNWQSGRTAQGGSTITQQLARKVFLNDEKSYERKLREVFISLGVESNYSKKEILEMYLNTVPYGPRVNGVAVASKMYFDKDPIALTDSEALVLAVLPKDPVRLTKQGEVAAWLGNCPIDFVDDTCSPFRDLNYDFSRVESLLFAVAKNLNWSPEYAQSVWEDLRKIEIPNHRRWVHDDYQHFRFYIQDFLKSKGLDLKSEAKGLVVKTTLDADLQDKIYNQIRIQSGQLFADHWMTNLAVLILDHETRGPLVWIGSKSFWNSDISGQVDLLRSRRQTGSTIKPFIYAAAIEQGYQPPTIFYDSVVNFRGDNFRLRNSDGHFQGGIRMTQALAQSRNIPAAKALLLAGGEARMKKYLDQRFGFDIWKNFKNHAFGWTLSLGTADVKLTDLANAYATLGSGEHLPLCPIIEIRDLKGQKLSNPCGIKIARKISPKTQFFISDILANKEARPPEWNQHINTNKPMAVKTGTSSKRVNNLILPVDDIVIGYTPEATVMLWGGNTNGQALKPGSVAIYALGSVWRDLANIFLENYPHHASEFKAPEPLQQIHGEWATLDYTPPSYARLNQFVWGNPERGINPLNQLGHEN